MASKLLAVRFLLDDRLQVGQPQHRGHRTDHGRKPAMNTTPQGATAVYHCDRWIQA
jgi:hypothetical protein